MLHANAETECSKYRLHAEVACLKYRWCTQNTEMLLYYAQKQRYVAIQNLTVWLSYTKQDNCWTADNFRSIVLYI